MAKKLRDELANLTAGQRAVRRARAVGQAASKIKNSRMVYNTGHGTVHIDHVVATEDDEQSSVDVHLGGETESGETHFRVVNPPMLVRDPVGDIEVRGIMYREDPLAAVAEAIALHGGARLDRGKRRRA